MVNLTNGVESSPQMIDQTGDFVLFRFTVGSDTGIEEDIAVMEISCNLLGTFGFRRQVRTHCCHQS